MALSAFFSPNVIAVVIVFVVIVVIVFVVIVVVVVAFDAGISIKYSDEVIKDFFPSIKSVFLGSRH